MAGDVYGGGMHGGDVWQGACMAGEMPPDTMRYGRSMRGRYASYWNAFFFLFVCMFCYYYFVIIKLNINRAFWSM